MRGPRSTSSRAPCGPACGRRSGARRRSPREAIMASIWSSSRRRFSRARDVASRTSRRTKVCRCREIGVESQRAEQDADLREFGVKFDVISCESSLYRDGLLQQTLNDLATRGYTYEQDGALWLRTTAFGDDKDRVLRKSDGTYTYLLPDIAYHRQKHERGFAREIDVLGADHHGYVGRMQAAMQALGYPKDFYHAVLVQLVRVMRGGEEVRFSKRSGEFVTLRDLFLESGVDAAR